MDRLDIADMRDPFLVETTESGRRRASASERRAKLWLTLALWASNYFVFTLSTFLQGSAHPGAQAVTRLAVCGFGLAVCYALHCLLRWNGHRSFRTRAVVLMIAAPIAAESHAWVNFFAFQWVNSKPMAMVISNWGEALFALSLWTWFFVAWAGLYLALEYSFGVKEEERRSSTLRGLAHAAKLRALSNQVNPHFLFNALNAISSLMLDQRTADAERMLTELSAFFRHTLAIDPMTDITLETELDLHLRYLAIEQIRYPDLVVDVVLPDALRNAAVPALILQPIVENAVKHGVAKSDPPTRITLTAANDRGRLTISVRDCGVTGATRRTPANLGIGLANVRERLVERFGDLQHLTAEARSANGFEVVMSIPLAIA
jgi:two-component system, LytTR family, sensor kinase